MLGYKLRAMIVFNNVRMGGLEPHVFRHQILSLARLPLRHMRAWFGAAKLLIISLLRK